MNISKMIFIAGVVIVNLIATTSARPANHENRVLFFDRFDQKEDHLPASVNHGEKGRGKRSGEAAASGPAELLKNLQMMMQLMKAVDGSAAAAAPPADPAAPPTTGSGDAPPPPPAAASGGGGGLTPQQLLQFLTLFQSMSGGGAASDDANVNAQGIDFS